MHLDRTALLHGSMRLLDPVYQGPKAFLYFDFIVVSLIVLSFCSPVLSRVPASWFVMAPAALYAAAVAVTGVSVTARIAEWPGVFVLAEDKALVERLARSLHVALFTNTPAEEKYWRQMFQYFGVWQQPSSGEVVFKQTMETLKPAMQSGVMGSDAIAEHTDSDLICIVSRFDYAFSRGIFTAKPHTGASICGNVVDRSAAFIACGAIPKTWARVVNISARPQQLDPPSQPLLTCGVTGNAIVLGLRKVETTKAVLLIDEWGNPEVDSVPFDVPANQPLQFRELLDWREHEVVVYRDDRQILSAEIHNTDMAACEFEVGRNSIGATTASREFRGKISINENAASR